MDVGIDGIDVVDGMYVTDIQVDVGAEKVACTFAKIVGGALGAGEDPYPAYWVVGVQGQLSVTEHLAVELP